MEYSQRDAEALVRLAYDGIKDDPLWERAGVHCIRVARILRVLDTRPELLHTKRLEHNLGKTKHDWMLKLYEDYRQEETP